MPEYCSTTVVQVTEFLYPTISQPAGRRLSQLDAATGTVATSSSREVNGTGTYLSPRKHGANAQRRTGSTRRQKQELDPT